MTAETPGDALPTPPSSPVAVTPRPAKTKTYGVAFTVALALLFASAALNGYQLLSAPVAVATATPVPTASPSADSPLLSNGVPADVTAGRIFAAAMQQTGLSPTAVKLEYCTILRDPAKRVLWDKTFTDNGYNLRDAALVADVLLTGCEP